MSSKQDAAHPLKVAGVVSFYMGAALVMVFVNKAVLQTAPSLPLLFLLNQLLIAVILLHLGAFATPRIDLPHLDLPTAKKLFPVVSVNIVGLVFNTLCLRDVEASFFQIARGLQLPLTIAVSSFVAKKAPSKLVIFSASIVTFGFLLGVSPSLGRQAVSDQDTPTADIARDPHKPSLLSLFYGFLSSLFIAVHAVLIKSSLPHCNNSTIQLAYWTNLGSAVLILPFVLLGGEAWHITTEIFGDGSSWWASEGFTFFWGSIVTGVFGFLLCVAGLLSIKVTSPVTHMFSSAARSVLQTLLGVWIFHDLLTVNRALSILVILGGTMYYTYVKSLEQGQPPAPATKNNSGNDLEMGVGRKEEGVALFSVPEDEEEGKA
ncbi:hypothetical protein GLOTRDRAFT_68030 [Gloeophyllum trabeum ATCC 11539]|uniref:GDP-mannose transporter n=1 Tax=Gloeophyllum trabeum (strain ATCC 11539 / FP-39264 / Madison 617) TaxID=670483 RepID=S7QLW3_GLOTA|nr:uncharacterized protein GLOTRDRAFT_68030 [Gloeophyllum trabeum ATCC 11539]EPQ60427.1 hypothetical protein GLOTRDRAFT_68030 [Gloeophyllum trabeum ATCC 11539]